MSTDEKPSTMLPGLSSSSTPSDRSSSVVSIEEYPCTTKLSPIKSAKKSSSFDGDSSTCSNLSWKRAKLSPVEHQTDELSNRHTCVKVPHKRANKRFFSDENPSQELCNDSFCAKSLSKRAKISSPVGELPNHHNISKLPYRRAKLSADDRLPPPPPPPLHDLPDDLTCNKLPYKRANLLSDDHKSRSFPYHSTCSESSHQQALLSRINKNSLPSSYKIHRSQSVEYCHSTCFN